MKIKLNSTQLAKKQWNKHKIKIWKRFCGVFHTFGLHNNVYINQHLPNAFVGILVAVGDATKTFPVHPAHGRRSGQAIIQALNKGQPEMKQKVKRCESETGWKPAEEHFAKRSHTQVIRQRYSRIKANDATSSWRRISLAYKWVWQIDLV